MHIAEGYLPVGHAVAWTAVAAPFVAYGGYRLQHHLRAHPENRVVVGAVAAFAFVLSALKLPSVTGSSSHPTGTGLGAVLFGPALMAVLGPVVLLFQALLLAHGGLTTLGANTFSMAVVGPWIAYGVFRAVRGIGAGTAVAVFFAAALGNLATYFTTALQLALAFPDPASGFAGAYVKFAGVFAVTQIPLAVVEGLVTVWVVRLLRTHAEGGDWRPALLQKEGWV